MNLFYSTIIQLKKSVIPEEAKRISGISFIFLDSRLHGNDNKMDIFVIFPKNK